MKALLLGLLLTIASSYASVAEEASYYRAWQGFKKPEFTQNQFNRKLPSFMNSTLEVYGDKLNQYLVAVPPKNKPGFVPDEFALVAVQSEQDYKDIRATPAGAAYGESHWAVFNKEISKSAPFSNFYPSEPDLVSNQSYDLIGSPNDWKSGHTTFFLGLKKSSSGAEFLSRLKQHVNLVAKSFRSMGLKGYIIIANENYEAAYMNWESKDAMDEAFYSHAGKAVQKDGAEFMEILQWSDQESFNGSSVKMGGFYNTLEY